MCGICGYINLNNKQADGDKLLGMMKILKHRGPDDEGTFIHKNVALGFVRLKIIDLSSAGHQPMISEDKRYTIIFNGEIYNYIELRETLKKKGHVFKTKTDTEVLLKAYIEWRENCLHYLNGMWVFLIYDTITGSIFISRDRYGIKPFYYTIYNEQFIFASEIPGILNVMDSRPKVDKQSVYDYLVFNRTDQTESTFFDNIKKLQHGHQIKIQDSKVLITKWYHLEQNLKSPFQSSDEYLDTFCSAIQLRLRSDVPVGVCLSGGLDSSAIVSILQKKMLKDNLNTFSAIYEPGADGDESQYIMLFKDSLKNMYFTKPTGETLFNDLENFVAAHAEPVPTTSQYAQFKVMQLAKEKVTVTLDGQGADEQLAGYHYFFGMYFKELFVKRKWFKMTNELVTYYKNHHSVYGFKTLLFFLLPYYFRSRIKEIDKSFINTSFAKKYRNTNYISNNLYATKNIQELLLNHFEYKLEHLLKWEDRNSMYHSIEARTPFLDYRLVEHTLSINSDMIIRSGTTKAILRDAIKDIVNDKIRLRHDKIGFRTPADNWFRNKTFIDLIESITYNKLDPIFEFINRKKMQSQFQSHLEGKININRDIWKWIHLHLWLNKYF